MRNTRLTAEVRYPTTATHFGWSARSESQPPRMRTNALTPWYMPSMKPYASADIPRTEVM